MLSHLRARNRTVEKGVKDIEDYIKGVAKGVELDERGRCRLQYGQVGVHVVIVPEHNLVMFKTFTNFLPDPDAGTILPLYYHLLDINDEPATGLAYFSIVAAEEMGVDQDVISVELKRPITDISEEEFKVCLEAVGEVANKYMSVLEEQFKAPRVP